jgi:hypothetical protein
METFDIQVLLKDGSFADYEVRNDDQKYQILQNEKPLISFKADEDGTWSPYDNVGNIDEDLQERIINQLNGFKI